MNIIKRLYEAVIVDDYIEGLTPEFVSTILSNTHRKTKQSRPKMEYKEDLQPDSTESIEDIPVTDHDDVMQVFGKIKREYSRQELSLMQIQLVDKLVRVKNIIVGKSPGYMSSIEESFVKSQEVARDAEITRPKVTELKEILRRLQMFRSKSEKIVDLRIKFNNLRLVSNFAQKMPDPNQMRLPDLKQISLQEWLKQLKCYESIQRFIQLRTQCAYTEVIQSLELSIVVFNERHYQDAFNRYLDLQVSTPFQQLLLSVLVKQIRRFDVLYFQLASDYVLYMKNFMQICLWHKNNPKGLDTKDQIISLRPKIWNVMEEHLTEVIREMIGLSAVEILQLGCHINRLIQIGEGFSDTYVGSMGKQLLNKQSILFNTSFQKHLLSVGESLLMEESNNWSRLPVDNNYRHNLIENTICNIVHRSQNSVYLQLTSNDYYYLHSTRKENETPSIDETWDLTPYKADLTPLEPYKYKKLLATLSEPILNKEVVICQSVLPVLKFYEQMSELLFSLSLVTERVLAIVFFITDFYLYYLFITFTPEDVKKLIKMKPSGAREIYQKAKINSKYPTVVKFMSRFEEEFQKNKLDSRIRIQESRQEAKMVRSRVIAIQSFGFITTYLSFCLENLKRLVPKMQTLWIRIQDRFKIYPLAQKQLSELLYSECVFKLANIEPLLTPIWRLGWQNTLEATQVLLDTRISLQNYMRDFLQRLRATSKGEIPCSAIQEVYILFCKYISRFIQNRIVKAEKITVKGKELLVMMLKDLQAQMNNQPCSLNFTDETIGLIKVSESSEWQEVQSFIKESINRCNLSFTGLVSLASSCRASQGLQKSRKQQRQKLVQQYIYQIHP